MIASLRPHASAFAAAIGALTLDACTHPQQAPAPNPVAQTPTAPPPLFEWNGDGVAGPVSVKIDVDEQRAYVYKGDRQVGWSYVASGIRSKPTPTGNFKIAEKTVDKKSNLWGKIYDSEGDVVVSDAKSGRDAVPEGGRFEGARMPYWMRLTGDGVGMHAGPIPNPGSRASHGCIRLPRDFAPILFENVSIGTPVSVVGDGPRWTPSMARSSTPKKPSAAPSKDAQPSASQAVPPAATAPATKEEIKRALPALPGQ